MKKILVLTLALAAFQALGGPWHARGDGVIDTRWQFYYKYIPPEERELEKKRFPALVAARKKREQAWNAYAIAPLELKRKRLEEYNETLALVKKLEAEKEAWKAAQKKK